MFVGVCHPKGEQNDYKGFLLKASDMPDKCRELEGKKILFEHNKDCEIGKVQTAWVDASSGKLKVCGYILENDNNSKMVAQKIRNGTLSGLSLGMKRDVLVNKNKEFVDVVYSQINELSICEEGDLDHTVIETIASKLKKTQTTTTTDNNNNNNIFNIFCAPSKTTRKQSTFFGNYTERSNPHLSTGRSDLANNNNNKGKKIKKKTF